MKRLAPAVLLVCLAVLLPASFSLKASPKPVLRPCGTELTAEEAALLIKETPSASILMNPQVVNYCIPISLHIVRKDDGTGGISLNQFYKGLQDANAKYVGTGLTFHIHDISYIDDSDYYFNIDTKAEIDAMLGESPVANTVNVYCTPNLSDEKGGLCGRGSFTTSVPQGIALNNGCVGVSDNDSSFPHELGHYFDLLHTHETANGAELVTRGGGANCTTAGDGLCDTPADPGLDETTNIDNSCTYTGTEKDADGASYTPDTHALMSYAPKLCRDTFSAQSQAKIINTLTTKRAYLLDFGCPPDAQAGTDITAECTGSGKANVKLDGSGSSDPDNDTITYKWSASGVTFDDDTLQKPTGGFAIGKTTVRLIVTDTEAYADTDYVDVTVEDTTPPDITCPADTTVECASHCGTPSLDIASWLAEAGASDTCDPSLTVTNNAPTCFPEGETIVKFRVEDSYGNADSCTAKVTVVDTTPPKIDVVQDRNVLWPPNHKLVEVCATVTVTDVCDPNPTWVLWDAYSDEPDNDKGDGNTFDDIQDDSLKTADACISLRSERMGGENGRKYTIVYKAFDSSNNFAYDTTCVRVPHDQSASAVCASGFSVAGTSLQSGATSFALVIPGSSTLNVYGIDEKNIYVGNTAATIKASSTRRLDINQDGKTDLAVVFEPKTPAQISALAGPEDFATFSVEDGELDAKTISDGPVGLHFASTMGVNYLVSNIYVLGTPVVLPNEPTKRGGDPKIQATPNTPTTRVTTLWNAHPNPFNPQTTIDFTLASGSAVSIAIYDVRGALVKTLVDETMSAGDHSARWNGVDEQGRAAASGIYFVRMVAGSYSQVRKIVMLK